MEMMTRLDFLKRIYSGCSPSWSKILGQKLFILFVSVPVVILSAEDSKIRCTVSSVLPLSDANLKCYFPEDISITRKDFTVYHHYQHGSPVAVIDCWWIKGKLDCYSQHGVEYNKTVGKSLTLTLKQVTSAHTGKYACQVSGYESSSLEICELHLKLGDSVAYVKGTENTCRITHDKSGGQARLDCFFSKDIAEARKSFAVYRSYGRNNQAVLAECLWENNQPKCQVASGYQLQDAVSSYLTLWIQEVTKEKAGNYSCLPAGSLITPQNTCFLSVSEKDGNITCSVPVVKPLQDTVLTCSFPEDLNVTKKDFSIYHYNNGGNSDAVLDCWWYGGNMDCIQSPSVQFKRIVSKTLSLTILRVTTNNTGIYACQVAGYHPNYIKTCDLQVKIGTGTAGDDINHSLGVGLSVGVLLVVVLVIAGFILLRYKGRTNINCVVCKSHSSQPDYESQIMLQNKEERKRHEIRKDREEINKMFEEYLEKEVSTMFPNICESAYFVPPVYFNKTREKQLDVADQTVTVLEPPDPCDVRHDRAMQHVLNCLHHVAMAGVEQMFVLTQFKYTDYLNSIPEQFKGHLLPVPSLTQEQDQNQSFDFLIIHRRYGVMVGVVKDCSSNDAKSQPEIDTETTRPKQVPKVMEQLNTAERFVSEVMSDKASFPKLRKVLVLFNILQPTVERFTRDITGINQNPSELWRLHFEHVPGCMEPNSASSLNTFKEEWDKFAKESQDSFTVNENHYLAILGRFCGPATTSVLSMEGVLYQLPKSLSQAVSLTGDMFKRTMLYPKMTKLLEKPFLFLAGPPGTGKTRMLALVGRKWVCEGHPVHIISTSPGGEEAAMHLHQLISSSVSSKHVNVFHLKLNLEDTTSVTGGLDTIQRHSNEAYVIAVELNFQMKQAAKRFLSTITKGDNDISNIPTLGNNIQRKKTVPFLFTELRHRFPNLHMWGAGCTDLDIQPRVPDLRMEFLTECLTCPPSVLREACEETRISGVGTYTANQSPVPTSGPPVKHLYHRGQGHFVEHPPQECKRCARDIINILIHDLCIQGEHIKIDVTQQEIHTNHQVQSAPIRYSDILIFFESDVNEKTPMVQSLVAEGILVQVMSHQKQSTTFRQEKSSVLVAKSSLYLGYRRKVVVFVEGKTDSNDITVRWNRLRCWTCCTSQLILVHNIKT